MNKFFRQILLDRRHNMCLNKVHKTFEGKDQKEVIGYKVFYASDIGLVFEIQTLNGSYEVKRGRWIKTRRTKPVNFRKSVTYVPGFHVFATKAGATSRRNGSNSKTIVRVKGRGLLAVGGQYGRKVLVFRELFVPKAA